MANRKRSKLVIEPKIQYSLIRQLTQQWACHLVGTVILLTLLQFLLGGIFNDFAYHWERIWPTIASFVVSLVILLPIFILGSLKLSNRFAGPIHRLRREFRDMAAGKAYQQLKFRDNDFWPEVAGEFEEAVQSLRSQLRQEVENEYAAKSRDDGDVPQANS